VLFVDVEASVERSARVDPEDWQRLMDRLFGILRAGIERFGGTVDKFTGDGAVALFGAPIADEDHARRGCYAALQLRDELAGEELGLGVRLGLSSGEVVVGLIGDEDYTAIGHTVGLAARMQELAEPGTVYITEHTAALVDGHFDLIKLGPFRVKGAPRRVVVHELAGAWAPRTRLEVSAARGLSPFVGRDAELAVLEAAVARAGAGEPSIVAIAGDAGVGKSRLCHELTTRCRAANIGVWHMVGRAHLRNVEFAAVRELLRTYFGVDEEDDPAIVRATIEQQMLAADATLRDALPLVLGFLLGEPDGELLAMLDRVARAHTRTESGVIIVENLQWLDPGSRAFVERLTGMLAGTCLLLVVTSRTEIKARRPRGIPSRRIALGPLPPDAVDTLLANLLDGDTAMADAAGEIRRRTGGNPFFAEEVVLALRDTGELAIPPTVQALIAARIDRLGEREKAVLQAAAVIGGRFSERLMRRVTGLGRRATAAALRVLVARHLLTETAGRYAFATPLIEEAAFAAQTGEQRALLERAVAGELETRSRASVN